MDIQVIARDPDAFQQPVAVEHIKAMCVRAFGASVAIESIRELDGGSINNTYLIGLAGMTGVILRVAQAPGNTRALEIEGDLLRRELHMQPFFAPIAALIPRTLMADFTHQIVDRDYVFQTRMSGEIWSEIEDDLTPDERASLWRQLGSIARQIHAVTGATFGPPYPRRSFATWSAAVIVGLEGVAQDLERYQIDTAEVKLTLDLVATHTGLLDAVKQPHLLHGDLWLRHLFAERGQGGPTIVGLIDAEFASWGDPLFEWTLIRLALLTPQGSEAFWETYGPLDQSVEAQFRAKVCQAWSLGGSLAETWRLKNLEGHTWVRNKLREVTAALQSLIG
jgi:aminoglycoside phosphotransferase (APT) family kinase protein